MMVQANKMAEKNLNRLMLEMSIPSIVAQIINVLYNIVDRIYIGHIPGIGAEALTGVGVTFPIITLISAFSAFIGTGGAPLSSIWLGKGEQKKAEKILGNSVSLLLIFTVILMAFFYIFEEPILYLFGASEATYQYASSYIRIYLVGTVFVELALGLNSYIISQGFSTTAMLSVLIGAITNIILDPILIYLLGLGVAGAGIATVISQALSCIWVVGFLAVNKRAVIRIKLSCMKPDLKIIKSICSLGISPFVMRSTESLITIVMNHQLAVYGGDLYVGTLTILQSILQLITTPLNGFTQGIQPIISYNFGAGNFTRVKQCVKRMLAITTAFSAVTTFIVIVFSEIFARMFTVDTQTIALVCKVMPIFMFGMLFFGLQMGIQPTFLALGQAKISLFIAMLRKVILLVPLAIILSKCFGAMGVFYAEPSSDLISAFTAVLFFACHINKILSKETLEKI